MESRKFDPSVLTKKPFRGIMAEIAKEEHTYRSNIWYRINTAACKKTLDKVAAKMQERIELEERLSRLSAYGK